MSLLSVYDIKICHQLDDTRAIEIFLNTSIRLKILKICLRMFIEGGTSKDFNKENASFNIIDFPVHTNK